MFPGSDNKIRPEQVVKQCAYTSVSFWDRVLTFSRALGTDHRNGAVLLTESSQFILYQKLLKRLTTKAWLGHI